MNLAYEVMHGYDGKTGNLEDIVEHCVYEKVKELGVPFEPIPNWAAFYSSGPEIPSLLRAHGSKIQPRSRRQALVRNRPRTVRRPQRHLDPQGLAQKAASSTTGAPPSSSRPASSGTGNGPTSPGLHRFAGLDVHSAAWDEEWDCSGEKAAVIGNGSSAIQMMPEVAKSAARVVNFIKNSTWITLGLVRLSEEEKRSKEEPEELSRHRKEI
ncbi:hypothetical protein PMIN07_000101 [Paraphaeosphaeria minitans]